MRQNLLRHEMVLPQRAQSLAVMELKDDRQRFLQKVSKKQFRTVYYNTNACG